MLQKTFWLLCSLLILSLPIFGQNNVIPHTSKKGTIKKKDGYAIKFTDLKLVGKEISYLEPSGVRKKMPISDIFQIEERRGSYAGVGAAAGGGMGLIAGILNAKRLKDEDEALRQQGFSVEETNTGPIIGLFTGLGIVSGLVTGLCIKKEVIVYDANKPIGVMKFEVGSVGGLAGIGWFYRF